MRSLILIGLLAFGALPALAAAHAKPAAKAAAQASKPAAKPAPKAAPAPAPARPAKPAAPQGPFDARDPASLIALLASMDAQATVAERAQTDVKLNVVTPGFSFGAQYVDCAANGKGCQALAFSTSSDKQRATLTQLNAFNQTSVSCRLFMDKAGAPHVVYSTLLSASDTREEMRTQLGVWQGCLAAFGAFLTDPNGYLASAP